MIKLLRFPTYIIVLLILVLGCQQKENKAELKTGYWRGEITIQEQQLPFNFEVIKTGSKFTINLHDGDNIITLDEVSVKQDSVFFTMHIFDIDVKAKISDNKLLGSYTKNYADDYVLPFKATFGKKTRLDTGKFEDDFNGKWSIKFHEDNGTDNETIGIFKIEDAIFKGTILTKTGDYRFLEGSSENGTFILYGFDGNHLFIFKAQLENGILMGDYWSGKTFHQKFTGIRDENASLPDANSLTFLKDGYDSISFSFPDLDGDQLSLNDPKYQNKVVVLQLFGTWCPNCMDETKFLTQWYDKNRERGVEIVGLAYEVKDDFDYAKKRVSKMKDKLNVNYDFVIAGTSANGNASKSLPMLNHVMSFPTSIIIDKKGKVRSIHTGFTGPATGDYYLHYVEEFNTLMDSLLLE